MGEIEKALNVANDYKLARLRGKHTNTGKRDKIRLMSKAKEVERALKLLGYKVLIEPITS